MTEAATIVESNKPNPVSLHEWYSMSGEDQYAFVKKLSIKEQVGFLEVMNDEYNALPAKKRREIDDQFIKELTDMPKKKMKDKITLAFAKGRKKLIETLDKTSFGRKLVEPSKSKLIHLTSPYVIKSSAIMK